MPLTKKQNARIRPVCICAICDDQIVDSTQQSIWCEGHCDTWLHRGCAGLSKAAHLKQWFRHCLTAVSLLTETWCHSNISDREILPTGYTLYRNDRDFRGGDVLLAISNTICSEQKDVLLTLSVYLLRFIHTSLLFFVLLVLCMFPPPLTSLIFRLSWIISVHLLADQKLLF